MLSVTAICDQYAWLYTSLPIPVGTWDHIIPVDGCYVAIKRIDGIDYVMFRGSITFRDWVADIQQLALPYLDPLLGPVHPGAQGGLWPVLPLINTLCGPKVVLVGHSLGAMHAALAAGYRLRMGFPVEALIMFGEPRSGGLQLSSILSKTNVQSYRNADKDGHDYVTDVPPCRLPSMPYQHVKDPLIDCWHSPNPLELSVFKYHHFGHYCRAFGCGAPQALALPI